MSHLHQKALVLSLAILIPSSASAQQPTQTPQTAGVRAQNPPTTALQNPNSPQAQIDRQNVLSAREAEWAKLKTILGSAYSFNPQTCTITHTIDPNRIFTRFSLKDVAMTYRYAQGKGTATLTCAQGQRCVTNKVESASQSNPSASIERSLSSSQSAQLSAALQELIKLCRDDNKLPPAQGGKA